MSAGQDARLAPADKGWSESPAKVSFQAARFSAFSKIYRTSPAKPDQNSLASTEKSLRSLAVTHRWDYRQIPALSPAKFLAVLPSFSGFLEIAELSPEHLPKRCEHFPEEFPEAHTDFLRHIYQKSDKKPEPVPPYLLLESAGQSLPKRELLPIDWHQTWHYGQQKLRPQSAHKLHGQPARNQELGASADHPVPSAV